ncbi:MAG: hypothetical protein HY691_00690 [Chloroflexi bacterium]|nr:hypothetical protein [Chloroflexota bacterium]
MTDETFWPLSARERAAHEFDPLVVEIFYDDVESRAVEPWNLREEVLPLPGLDDGYARILVVGATGGGKTTLLRQFIGTDAKKERFPSISTAKTTIFDTEIVIEEGGLFRAVVSFLPRDRVRSYVEECVTGAVSAAVSGQREEIVLRRLLEHHEQRFRLSYVLGTLSTPTRADAGGESDHYDDLQDDVDFEEEAAEGDDGIVEVDDEERTRFQERLRSFLTETVAIAEEIRPSVASALDIDPKKLSPDDRDAFLELVENEVAQRPRARDLVDKIVSEIEVRFSLLAEGEFEKDGGGWPATWSFESGDRQLFIKTINRFSSNYAPNFGKLLAPVVQGLRVAGPFRPTWVEDGEATRLVFIDGEGLGHTPASVSSLPTSITKRYDLVDVILLVDNAAQPMQAAGQAVLRSVAASGHDAKLAITFTHFDQVRGDNLPTIHDRRGHVLASLENTLRAVEEAIGSGAGRRLRRRIEERVFFVSKIQDPLSDQNRLTRDSLHRLLNVFRRATISIEAQEAVPIYDMANLVLAVERATEQFHENWHPRLGVAFKPGVPAEHWSRIKALSRRFAYQWEDQYDTLRPVADLIRLVSERLAAFLVAPRDWEPAGCAEGAKEAAVDRQSREVYTRIHKLMENRLFRDHVAEWLVAYEFRGTGSTRPRAQVIRGIYEAAAPILAEVPGKASTELLDVFRDLFREAAEAAGAKVVS